MPRQSSDEYYEKLPSPEAPMIITRAEPVRVEDIPRVPTISPPARPTETSEEDDVYEEIFYTGKTEIRLRVRFFNFWL